MKKIIISVLIILLCSATLFYINVDKWKYLEDVKVLNRVQVEEIYDLIKEKDHLIIYIGKSSCQGCQKFVHKLKNIIVNADIEIYYIDIENINSNLMEKFIDDYQINYVPKVLIFKNNKVFSPSLTNLDNDQLQQVLEFKEN